MELVKKGRDTAGKETIATIAISHSQRLAKIPQKDTSIELAVRRKLTTLGLRYRLKNRDLPGSPDIANRSGKWAVFVNGCYWHHHRGCRRATIPKSNRDFWLDKFEANRRRDLRVLESLHKNGFLCCTIWECELKDSENVADDKLCRFLCEIDARQRKTR